MARPLRRAAAGKVEESRRYRELLAPRGIERELRASLVTDRACWGAVGLYRGPDAPDFTDSEAAFVASVAAHLAEGLRRALVVGDPLFDDIPDGPGVVILDQDDRVASVTEPAGAGWPALRTSAVGSRRWCGRSLLEPAHCLVEPTARLCKHAPGYAAAAACGWCCTPPP